MKLFGSGKIQRNLSTDINFRSYTTSQNPEYLIHQDDIAQYTEKIRSLVALPSQHYSLLYNEPLKNTLRLTQATEHSKVVQRLTLVVEGIKLRRAYILPKKADPECIREKKDIWTYATFMALLMYDLISLLKPIEYYKSEKMDGQRYIWYPAINTPPEFPYVFRVLPQFDNSAQLTPLLIPHIFDEHCFNWLAQDQDALNEAVESMVSPKKTSSIGPLIIKTYSLDVERTVAEDIKNTDQEVFKSVSTPGDGNSNKKINTAVESGKNKVSSRSLGQSFLDWAKNKQHEHEISINNQSLMYPVPQGIALVTPEIFKHYAAIKEIEWKTVQNGFLKLKLHQKQEGTHKHIHKLNRDDGSTVNVILLKSLPS